MTRNLSQDDRRQFIIEYLNLHGRTTVQVFAEALGVSAVTIRHDLNALEEGGLLLRVHGGALPLPHARRVELGFDLRMRENSQEKRRIAYHAAQMVQTGDAIGMDGSTTVCAMVPFLKHFEQLTVVTNSIALAQTFLDSPQIRVLLPAGQLRPDSASIVNRPDTLPDINLNLGFFSAHGLTPEHGITEMSQEEVDFKQHVIRRCVAPVLLLDSSKWGRVGPYTYAQPGDMRRIITSATTSRDQLDALRAQGVRVELAAGT